MTPTHLFDASDRKDERDEPCPLCGSPVKLKHTGLHSFWGCSAYPACDYIQSLHESGDFEPQSLPGEHCPECGSDLLLKKGRYGFFVGCSGFPACHFMLDPTAPKQTESESAPKCPACTKGKLVKRASKRGKVFYACNQYPKCDYALNEPPVAHTCPDCGWGVMEKREGAQGTYLRCPQKSCGYKTESV